MPDRLTSGGIIFGTLVQPPGSAGPDPVAPAPPAVTTLPRVLFVDDDPSIRQLVELALEELAIELVICASAAEARKALRQAPVKLLITDLMMPVMNGLVLIRALRQLAPELRIIATTGLDESTDERELRDLQVEHVVLKPYEPADLFERIATLLRGA